MTSARAQVTTPVRPDTARRDSTQQADSVLNVDLLGRLEFKGERTSNDRCFANQIYSLTFRCASQITPQLDFQFSLRSAGLIANRVRVDVDYDSQREFDGSNNISLAYRGGPGDFIERLEIGNVTFRTPVSRFLTSGIPSGNYGIQAQGNVGPVRFSAIAAQQRGNVLRDTVFTLGGRASRISDRTIHDYQVEARRFFFTIDPALFTTRYPNIDILNASQMTELAASLPETQRPVRVSLYRLILGGQPPNPNGPRFTLLNDPEERTGGQQVYELLREGVDYYVDPSQLWVALVRPLSLANERLVAAWTLRIGGRDTVIASLGGTPDLEFSLEHPQFAHLLWDPRLTPDDDAFRREIRSVYRLGGEDIRRETVTLRIVAGTSGDQEKPPGLPNTYLEIFRLAQPTNRALFDAENRLWPRRQDPNFNLGSPDVSSAELIRDVFIVFPSLEPFSRRGLAFSPHLVPNDTIYRTPGEYLYSAQHPQSFYRIVSSYESSGSIGPGTLALASSQIRPGSERLSIEGRPLVRHVDYEIDYDLGTVRLLTIDSLALRPRRVMLQYEENPLFTSVPTSVAGLTAEWMLPFGSLSFTAMSQRQRTNFTRPPLGFEPQASLVAGLGANLGWSLAGVSRQLARWLPLVDSAAPSRLEITAEVALSRPRQGGGEQAYIESFETQGGVTVNLLESQWQVSSQPALGTRLPTRIGASTLDTTRAATLVYQNYGTDVDGRAVTFTLPQIDPRATLAGGAISGFEQMLWLTLYPLPIGGIADPETGQPRWRVRGTPSGRRWRSVRTPLGTGGTGVDLTRGEYVEFWTQVDTSAFRRPQNPTLVLDFGDVSENRVAFAPESLVVVEGDSVYSGKQLQGWDRLDTERDRFSRAFSADVNDLGLPGHVVSELQVRDRGIPLLVRNLPTCRLGAGRLLPLGDDRINCTVRNSRLDEEDIDQDAVLNYTSEQRERERLRRFIVDLSRPESYNRIGVCGPAVRDVNQSQPSGSTVCWVQVRIPFNTPDDTIAGGPLLRRVRALRITVVSGEATADNRYTQLPIARLRVTGAGWLKRAARPLHGLGGVDEALGGFVIASSIGTQDRDSTRGLVYEPPPGVTDAAETQETGIGFAGGVINETSMRLLAGGMPDKSRAEAFLRFPEGDRNVMAYRELRAWAKGRGRGWGPDGDLQFFIKLGRDANNFYAYRTPVLAGGREAWEPEIRVPFERFYALRARLETAYLEGITDWVGCTAADSALIGRSALPTTTPGSRYAACDGGFIVYTVDPVVTPPNLAAVQEIAAGILRVDSLGGTNPPLPGDTLELWIDDIRLTDVEQRPGYAGYVGATFAAGDAGSIRISASRRDPFFRQLAERPSYLATSDLEIATTWRLEKLLPWRTGLALPLNVTYNAARADPEFLARSDLLGDAISGLRTPNGGTTTVTLQARLTDPVAATWWAPLVNHLGVSLSWNGAQARTAYQSGRTRGFDLGADYNFAPGLNDGTTANGLVPTVIRVISNLERSSGLANAFVRPTLEGDDEVRRTRASQNLWRSSTSLEFQPVPFVTARWDALSLRDLRDYGGVTPNAIAAAQERVDWAGVDVGLERERILNASLLFAPARESWVRPRFELASGYSMLRDPNAPSVTTPGSNELRLSRRFGNSQRASAAALLDLPRATAALPEDSWARVVARFLGAVDVSISRDQLSAYDAAPLTPGWRYQFGLAEFDQMREVGDVLASTAGAGTRYAASNTLTLPFGATIAQRVQRTDSRHYSRRLSDRLTRVDGEQLVYPDVTFRWAGQPEALQWLISNVSATVRAVHTQQGFLSPTETGATERRATRLRTYPATLTVTGPGNDLSLTLGFTRTDRTDSLPGSAGESRSRDGSADIVKAFPLPASWNLPGGLRTRLFYRRTETRSYVSNLAAASLRSRLTDNGRNEIGLNADTDLADDVSFSLQASRVVTFDRN
ncbi:MAG TPA: cell surface protein SprA, partial [Gemmatimonadaceae bacterium]